MKKLLAIIGVTLAVTVTNAASWLDLNFPTNDVSKLTFAFYPSYSPGLTLENGKKSEWGMGIAALWNVGTPITYIGVRGDWFREEAWAINTTISVQVPLKIVNVPVTPFASVGAGFPLSNFEEAKPGDVSPIVGSGVAIRIWGNEKFTLSGFYQYEYWPNFDASVHHPGAALSFSF